MKQAFFIGIFTILSMLSPFANAADYSITDISKLGFKIDWKGKIDISYDGKLLTSLSKVGIGWWGIYLSKENDQYTLHAESLPGYTPVEARYVKESAIWDGINFRFDPVTLSLKYMSYTYPGPVVEDTILLYRTDVSVSDRVVYILSDSQGLNFISTVPL